MSVVETLLGVLIGLWLIAFVEILRVRRALPKTRAADSRLCSCGHGVGLHREAKCVGDYQQPTFTRISYQEKYRWVRCRCTHFDGLDLGVVSSWQPPEVK